MTELKTQLEDKTGTYEIRIKPKIDGFKIISQVSIYMNFHKNILDMKKLFFEQLKMYHDNVIFDESNIIDSIRIQGLMIGPCKPNIQHLTNTTKIKDFECARPLFTFYFPEVVQIQLENNHSIFIFDSDDFVSNVNKFFKTKLSVDISKYNLNEKPIVMTKKNSQVFNSYGVNVIKQPKANQAVSKVSTV